MTSKNAKIKDIAQLLPEGLDKDTVEKICSLIEEVIVTQVKSRVNLLESKVKAFLISHMDEIKQSALAQLTEESDVYRNASRFEDIKALMALEIQSSDETKAISSVVAEQTEVEEENSLLVEELNKSITDNKKLRRAVKMLESKLKEIVVEKKTVETNLSESQEKNKLPFKSSEKGIVIAENLDERKNAPVKQLPVATNEFLTEEVMALMPKNN